jgi:hypothetical protein
MYYRYKLHELDGTEAGEAHYAVLIQAGEIIWPGDGRQLRVVDLLPTTEEDAPFVGACRASSLPPATRALDRVSYARVALESRGPDERRSRTRPLRDVRSRRRPRAPR